MATVNKTDIVSSLKQVSISPGDCLMVHSSLSSLGHVEGGADAVIDALLEAVGPGGTLVMPTFCQKERERRFECWDIEASPSDVGRITEVFRLRHAVVRSDHATHSVASQGPQANTITGGHRSAGARPGPWGPVAFGVGSPYDRLYDLQAKIVLIGVDSRFNTLVHYIEHLLVEFILCNVPDLARPSLTAELRAWNKDGIWPGFDRMQLQDKLLQSGLLAGADCGNARLLMCGVRETVDASLGWMRTEPQDWFETTFLEWWNRSF